VQIRLGGRNFDIATDQRGNPQVQVSSRPSQPDDGSSIKYAVWATDGHDLNSFEVIPPGATAGYLGRDYGVNTTGLFLGIDTLGPLINTVPLTAYDSPLGAALLGGDAVPGPLLGGGAVASSVGLGPAQVVQDSDTTDIIGDGTTTYAYVGRGSSTAKIDLDDFSFDALKLFPAVVTDILTTTPALPSVRKEISVAMGEGVAYQVLQQPSIGASDTWLTNSANQGADVFGSAPDRTVAMDGNEVLGNIQTGSVTMESPNWQTVSTITTQDVVGTGFALDGNLWILGTTDGPYVLDESTGIFFPLMPDLDLSAENCRNMQEIFGVGVVIPLQYTLRWQRYGAGASFGPETYSSNTSEVHGTVTGLAGSPREFYTIVHNECCDDSYLVLWKPQESGQHDRGEGLAPYVLAQFTDTDSRFLKWLGTVDGLRTNPTLMGGYGSGIFWMTVGRTSRWIDDANFRYAASGQTYLTEMRRSRNVLIDVEYIEGELSGTMGASQTVAVYLSLDSGAYTQVGSTQTSTGFKRFVTSSAGVPVSAFQGKHRAKPRIDYASNSSSAVPQWVGPLTMAYRTRPTEINVWSYTLDLPTDNVDTPYGYEAFLHDLSLGTAQAFESHDRQSLYVRVKDVTFANIDAVGNSNIDARGLRRQAKVTLEEFTTA